VAPNRDSRSANYRFQFCLRQFFDLFHTVIAIVNYGALGLRVRPALGQVSDRAHARQADSATPDVPVHAITIAFVRPTMITPDTGGKTPRGSGDYA
jgi:hypothetical protein